MSSSLSQALRLELVSRGYGSDLRSPHDTMVLDGDYETPDELVNLLDQMISRREKLFRSSPAVGPEVAKAAYDDVVLAIESIKVVLGMLQVPRDFADGRAEL